MSELDDGAWAEIRRLYETSDLSVRQICLRFGTNDRRIHRRAVAEGWHMRSVSPLEVQASAQLRRPPPRKRSARGQAAAAVTQPPAPEADDGVATQAPAAPRHAPGKRAGRGARYSRMNREELLSRIVRLAERNLAIMETHMETENGHVTAEERERSTRTVGTLVRTLEKVTELNTGNDDASATADIDRAATAELRRELAERIYRMWGRAKR